MRHRSLPAPASRPVRASEARPTHLHASTCELRPNTSSLSCDKLSGMAKDVAQRNLAIDTYRGLVMLLMMAEVLQLSRVSAALPGNPFWSFLAWNQTHVAWVGCSLHDTIQPGFSFLVGVALP